MIFLFQGAHISQVPAVNLPGCFQAQGLGLVIFGCEKFHQQRGQGRGTLLRTSKAKSFSASSFTSCDKKSAGRPHRYITCLVCRLCSTSMHNTYIYNLYIINTLNIYIYCTCFTKIYLDMSNVGVCLLSSLENDGKNKR